MQNKGYFANLSVAKFWAKGNENCVMRQLLKMFKILLASFLCPYFLCSFLHPAAWNVNVMTGALVAILGPKNKDPILGNVELSWKKVGSH